MKAKERQEHRARMDALRAEIQAIVDKGKCPQCGAGLRRNSALHGWWQCEQFGGERFRKEPRKPSCNWQGFTS